MPSTRIAFRPRPSFSRPSVEATSRPREVAHALEPVADRVAVGVQPRGGAGDVAVGVEERLERLHEVGLVLLVVGDERRDRLVVEALQLGRVLAHRGQQQPVGAGVLEGEHATSSLAGRVGDVGGQQRLVAGAVEVDRVVRDARVADREREAVQAGAQLARDRLGDAAHAVVVGGRAAARRRGRRVGRGRCTAASEPGAPARAARSAAASTRRAPVVVGGREVVGAHDDHGAAVGEVDARARPPRATMSPRSVTSRRRTRASGTRPGRPRTRGRARAGARPRRRSASSRSAAAPAGGSPAAGAQAQPADDRVADAQLVRSTPAASRISARSSAVERAATASTALERSISTSEASSARAAARTTSGSPRPDSTASRDRRRARRGPARRRLRAGRIGIRLGKSSSRAGRSTRGRRRPTRAPGEHEGGEDVDAQHERQHALAHAPVRPPGGHDDERRARRSARSRGRGAGDDVGLLVVVCVIDLRPIVTNAPGDERERRRRATRSRRRARPRRARR